MSNFDNTNRGVLFVNDRKQSDNHPDYKGSINIAGVDYWLSAWTKSGQKGDFLSLSLGDPKEQQQSQAPRAAPARLQSRPAPRPPAPASRPASGFDDMDSEIPF